jgi:cell division protein FtsB
MPDEEAFCALVQLLTVYGMRTLYTPDMRGVEIRFFQLSRLMEKRLPKLSHHFIKEGIMPSMYASQWILTVFAYKFPLELVYRIFDMIFIEGIDSIFKFVMALLKKSERKLLSLNFEHIIDYLKNNIYKPYEFSPGALMRDALEFDIQEDELEGYAREFFVDLKRANGEQSEIENEKHKNKQLQDKNRELQEEYNTLNQEHCQLANDMIQLRIDNTKIREENDKLQTSLMTLQRLLDGKRGEIEHLVKDEMDQLAQRNVELATKNHALQDEVLELEKMLIELKMKHAVVENERAELRLKLDMFIKKYQDGGGGSGSTSAGSS